MYLKERLKHAIRFRHKRGYGVHSPFVFNLILKAIRDKKGKYVYPVGLERELCLKKKEREFCRLLYRLSLYLDINSVWIPKGRREKIEKYLSVAGIKVVERDADMVCIDGKFSDILSIENISDWLVNEQNRRVCVILTGIHKSSINKDIWKDMQDNANVSIDMMWYGILFYDKKLQKGRYNMII